MFSEGIPISRKKIIQLSVVLPAALAALFYGGGYIAQFIYNYDVWQAGGAVFGTAPQFPDPNFFACIGAVFRWPSGLYGLGVCVGALWANASS